MLRIPTWTVAGGGVEVGATAFSPPPQPATDTSTTRTVQRTRRCTRQAPGVIEPGRGEVRTPRKQPEEEPMRVAIVVLLTVLSLLASTALAGAATTLHAGLSGKKEVPKAGNGRGTARLTLDAKKGRICFRIKLKHVGTVMMGHIHKGGKSTAGPIVVPLFGTATKQPKGCTSAKKSVIRAIVKKPGAYYVNVHTAKFPAGAARGQLH